MAFPLTSSRPFVPGTSGWSAADLLDPEIARLWDEGRYEIIEGVLTTMPPALYDGQKRLRRLVDLVEKHLQERGRSERFVFEVDIVLADLRVPKADAVLMTEADEQRQREENQMRGRPELEFGRILVPPTLLIESVSIGHEKHDQDLKRRWYAEARIPNYWIFEPYRRALTCLVLAGQQYRLDQEGNDLAQLHPSLFPGFALSLADIWV